MLQQCGSYSWCVHSPQRCVGSRLATSAIVLPRHCVGSRLATPALVLPHPQRCILPRSAAALAHTPPASWALPLGWPCLRFGSPAAYRCVGQSASSLGVNSLGHIVAFACASSLRTLLVASLLRASYAYTLGVCSIGHILCWLDIYASPRVRLLGHSVAMAHASPRVRLFGHRVAMAHASP